MKCKVSTTIPKLQELIDKYGQKLGFDYYFNGDPDSLIGGSEKKFLPKEEDRIKREQQKLYDLKEALKATNLSIKDRQDLNNKLQIQKDLIASLESKFDEFKRKLKVDDPGNIKLAIQDIYDQAELNLSDLERIFRQDNISYQELEWVRTLVRFWIAAGTFSEREDHLFLDKDEAQTPEIRERLNQYRNRADVYLQKYLKLAEDKLTADYNRVFNSKLSAKELFGVHKDSWGIVSQVLNLGSQDHALLNLIYKTIEEIKIKSEEETYSKIKKLGDLYKKAEPELKTIQSSLGNKTIWDVTKQVKNNGKLTGNATYRISQDFFDTQNNILNRARFLTKESEHSEDGGTKIGAKKAWKEFYKWIEDNTIDFDVRMLFPDENIEQAEMPDQYLYKRKTYADNIIENHKQELINQVGKRGYEEYLTIQEKLINRFKEERESEYNRIFDNSELSKIDKEILFETWLKENSPYWSLDLRESPAMRTKKDGNYYNVTYDYNKSVPKKIVNNKPTIWYDKNFEAIEKHDNAYNFYSYVLELLNENREIFGVSGTKLQMNQLPFIKAQLIDLFMERGLTGGMSGIWDKVMESLRTDDLATEDFSELDPLTGEAKKEIQINIINEKKQEIQDYVDLKIAQYKLENKKEPSYDDKKKFREDAIDYLAKQKSYDLLRIVEIYTLAAQNYKHKVAAESFIRIADDLFGEIKKEQTNQGGSRLFQDKKARGQDNLTQMQAALDYYLDERFYGIPTKQIFKQTDKKVFTKEEKVKRKELESTLEELKEAEGSPEDIAKLEKQVEELGGKVTGSNIIETLLKLVRIKGLGWNLGSAKNNLIIGKITNWVEASGQQYFTNKELRRGEKLAFQSMVKSVSFNKVATKDAKKLRSIMDRYNLLSRSSEEIFKRDVQSTLSKAYENIKPFNLTNIAEYQIQAPLFSAMMFYDNIWDALNDDGSIKEDSKLTQKELIDFLLKAKKVRDNIHGDYANPLRGQKNIAGVATMMYRKWLFPTFVSRFGGEKQDDILGTTVKGRYRSGVGPLTWSSNVGMSGFYQSLFTIVQLLRKLTLAGVIYDREVGATKYHVKGKFLGKDYQFSEIDAANLRKNLTELTILMSLMTLALILKAMLPDSDDEDEKIKRASMLQLINTSSRIQTDILLYIDPREFEKINKSFIPGFQLVKDIRNWGNAMEREFSENPDIQSGTFKGMDPLLKSTLEGLPITSSGMSLYKSSSYIFGEK